MIHPFPKLSKTPAGMQLSRDIRMLRRFLENRNERDQADQALLDSEAYSHELASQIF